MLLRAKEHPGLPATTRSWKKRRRILPKSFHKERGPARTLISDFWLRNVRE